MLQKTDTTFIEDWPNEYVETFTGLKFYVANPVLEDIRIEDIAHHLSNKCRYGGAVSKFYSVAQHSVYVSNCSEHKLTGLLHDAAEAYIPDVPRPLQRYVNGLNEIEANLHRVIAERFGTVFPYPADVVWADEAILADEARDLMATQGKEWYLPYPEGTKMIPEVVPWTPRFAEKMFLHLFRTLTEVAV
jgi:hypothetical protein